MERLAAIPIIAVGAWLILRRERWGRDVTQLTWTPRAAPTIISVIGALFIAAGVWIAIDPEP